MLNTTNESTESSIKIGDHSAAMHYRKGKLIGFTESHGRGRAAHAGIEGNENYSFGISGNTSKGEDGTIETCRILVSKLRSLGMSSSDPVEVKNVQHIDAQCYINNGREDEIINIQVVRAITDKSLWHSLGTLKHVDHTEIPKEDVASFIKDSIELKERKIEHSIRKDIILALNAIDTPVVCLSNVISHFQNTHRDWASSLGFRSIWLVGPCQEMVFQLDQ